MQLTKQHLPRPVTTPFRFPLFANAGSRRNSLWRGSRALMSVCAIVVSLANAQENPSHDDLSKQFMTSISQGKNAEVIAHFSPGLKATVTDAQMNAAWSSITQRLGAFSGILSATSASVQGQPTTFVLSQFANGTATLTVIFDAQDEIQGIWIAPNSTLTTAQMESVARAVADQLSSNDFSDVELKFDSTMQSGLPADKLSQLWSQALSQLGTFSQILVAQRNGQMDSVDVQCSFANKKAVIRVAFDADNKVGGLWILPAQ